MTNLPKQQHTVIQEGTVKSNLKDPPTTERPPPPRSQIAPPSSKKGSLEFAMACVRRAKEMVARMPYQEALLTLSDQIESLTSRLTQAEAEVKNARRTGEFWKAEKLAADQEIERLRAALLEAARLAQWPEGGADVGRKTRLNSILWHSLNTLGIKPGDPLYPERSPDETTPQPDFRRALQRLASMEAFTGSRTIQQPQDAELIARIEFAQLQLSGSVEETPESRTFTMEQAFGRPPNGKGE